MYSASDPRILIDLENGYFHGIRSALQIIEFSSYMANKQSERCFMSIVQMHTSNMCELLRGLCDRMPSAALESQLAELIILLQQVTDAEGGIAEIAPNFDASALCYRSLVQRLKSEMPE